MNAKSKALEKLSIAALNMLDENLTAHERAKADEIYDLVNSLEVIVNGDDENDGTEFA